MRSLAASLPFLLAHLFFKKKKRKKRREKRREGKGREETGGDGRGGEGKGGSPKTFQIRLNIFSLFSDFCDVLSRVPLCSLFSIFPSKLAASQGFLFNCCNFFTYILQAELYLYSIYLKVKKYTKQVLYLKI